MTRPLTVIDPKTLRQARDLRDDLAGLDIRRELPGLHRRLARELASKAQGRARALGGVHAHAAGSITGSGDGSGATIGIGNAPSAPVAFWGALKRTGWNAKAPNSAPQHPEWIGNSWDVGGPGGPYAINETIREEQAFIIGRYGDLIDTLARGAGFT